MVLSRKIEREGTISTIGKKSVIPKVFMAVAVLFALASGVYIAVDHGKTSAEITGNGSEIPPAAVEGPSKVPPLADPGIVAPFVEEHGLSGKFWIMIDKSDFLLTTWEGDRFLSGYTIATGENPGDKERVGDRRTPEGVFSVKSIHDSRAWVHDFGDGKGPVEHAYGPWFIRLETGWKGIGIHGTHDPSTLGKMVTEGCIRMNNEALLEIVERAVPGTVVLIEP